MCVYTHTHTHIYIYIFFFFYSKIALVIWTVCETTVSQQFLSVKPKLLQNPKRIGSLKLEYYIYQRIFYPLCLILPNRFLYRTSEAHKPYR